MLGFVALYGLQTIKSIKQIFMSGRYLLGFDVGSSSVKASLVDADSGACVASAFYPEKEAPIMAVKAGWAEQVFAFTSADASMAVMQ